MSLIAIIQARSIHLTFAVSFLLAALLSTLAASSFIFTPTELSKPHSETASIDLPFVGKEPFDGQIFTISTNYKLSFLTSSFIRVIPDDKIISIKVNNQAIDLSTVPSEKLSDFNNGFVLDLARSLQKGVNKLEFVIRNNNGDYGLHIEPVFSQGLGLILLVMWAGVVVLGLFSIFKFAQVKFEQKCAYILIAVFNSLQVFLIFKYNPLNHIWSDAQRHWEQGTQVLRQDLMAFTDPVLYQLYIGVIAKLSLNIPVLVAYFTSLLAVSNAYIWYRLFRELQTSKSVALWGCVAISALPSWMSIYSYFMQETLLLPLLGLALWSTWRCKRKATLSTFTLMVACWIAAGLTRGISIPLAAVCCTWLWVVQPQKIPKALYSVLILGLIMGPLTYRSLVTVHHFAPHGMGHLASIYSQSGNKEIEIRSRYQGGQWVHGFGSPSMGMKPFHPFSDWMTQRTGKVIVDVDLEKGSEDWQTAKKALNFGFNDYLWITKESIIFTFFASSWPDNNSGRFVDRLNSDMRFIWAPLFIVLIIASILLRAKMRGQWLLSYVIMAWIFVQVLLPISVSEGRYRKPLEGLLIAQTVLLIGAYRRRLPAQAQYCSLYLWCKKRISPTTG